MLNENPNKKRKNGIHITKGQLFWRIQRESWRRMLMPFLMYLFMGLVSLALSTLIAEFFKEENQTTYIFTVVIDAVCVLCGAAFNAHLCYTYGKTHYDAYVSGCLHRKNELFGIASGGDHHVEREYSPWKGFFIGFLVGVPVILLGGFGHISQFIAVMLFFTAWWAYVPASWVANYHKYVLNLEGFTVSTLWSLPMIVLPIVVSGVFYIVGAYVNRRNRELGRFTKEEMKERE